MKKLIGNIFKILICVFIIGIVLFPFYIIILTGTYSTQTMHLAVTLKPGKDFLYNLKLAYADGKLIYWVFNSCYVGIARAAVTCIVCLMCGYGLTKYQFNGNKALSAIIMATLMIPTSLGMVALLYEFRLLGWIDTHLPLIFAGAGSSFAVFWFQQTASEIPNELLDSARIDGSGEVNTFFKIAVPIMRPAIATIALITFINSWNDFVMPSIVLQNTKKFTIPVGMTIVNALYRTEHAPKILVVVLGILPIILIYALCSKQVIKGLTAGSVKG
ncbi:MAG: carbohydrate ABC transporter permease [Lachnospiraceae bacterium]|nr:carbohydrate ABC transporter permease [Lachnospiraceae bacterium]MBD5455603.1 carbohydrate ABC transporter permease [Lachnospiraceae bacterium]